MYGGSIGGVWVGDWKTRQDAVRELPRFLSLHHGQRFQTAKIVPHLTSEGIEYEREVCDLLEHIHNRGYAMIVLISGKQGSGKTTTAEGLEATLKEKGYIVKRFRFAQVIYEMHDECQKVLQKYGIQRPAIDGPLLQLLGTEYGRNIIDTNVWVKCAQNWMAEQVLHDDLFGKTVYVIDDMRFKNEFETFPDSLRIRLEADRETRKARRGDKWRDNETHASEIDLDDWISKFELVVRTDQPDVGLDKVVELIVGEIDVEFSERSGAAVGEGLQPGGREKSLESQV